MATLSDILNKSQELKTYYNKSNRDIQKIIENIYGACFRFGLNSTQTIYMIEQAIKPLKQDLLMGMMK